MAQAIVDGARVDFECCLRDHAEGDKYHGRNVAERFAHCAAIVKAYSTTLDTAAQGALAFRLAAIDGCLYHAEAVLFGGACKGACCEQIDLVDIDQAAA